MSSGGLVAGVAEHHALVARARNGIVGAERDVRALGVDARDHAAGVAVKAVLGAVVADFADDAAGDALDVDIAAGRDLAHDMDKAGGAGGLAGHARAGVFFRGWRRGWRRKSGRRILSGCPSVTDSDVNRNLDIRCLLGEMPCGGKMRGQKGNLPKTKARPPCRGTESALIAYLPVSRRTWHLTLRAGCWASQGLFPQPLLISCYSDVGDYLTTENCSCQRFFAGQFGCFA